MLRRRLFLLCLLALMMLSLNSFAWFTPQANAALTGSNWVEELTGLPFDAYAVDVDSKGNIFVLGKGGNDVYKSTDQGQTWTTVLDGTNTTSYGYLIFVDSRDYIYADIWQTGALYDLYRSTDGGDTWSVVIDDHYRLWHMAEDSNGYLYVNTYANTVAYVYRSTDQGATFSVWLNLTGHVSHIHSVGVDVANDDVYVVTGDYNDAPEYCTIRRWNGTAWANVTTGVESGTEAQPTDVWSDGSYVYFAPDANTVVYRIPSGGSWSQKEAVLDLKYAPQSSANFAFEAVKVGDLHLFGTQEGQLWGSWDGERWVKIYYTGSTTDSIHSISNRRPLYFVETDNGKLYRLNVQKEDLIKLYYTKYNSERGSITNAENYMLEQRIWNGTNYIDLTGVALSNVQVSIKGLSRRNYVLNQPNIDNAGWEWNNQSGWFVRSGEGTYGVASVTSEDKSNGTYSLKYVKNASDLNDGSWRPYDGQEIITTLNRGDILILSAYIRGNISSADRFQMRIRNNTSGSILVLGTYDLSTSWTRVSACYVCTVDSVPIRVEFGAVKGVSYILYFDSALLQKLEVGIAYENGDSNDAIQYTEQYSPFDFFASDINTTNPTITIAEQQISYAGELANGTESTPQSLSGILTGAVEVDANIGGSGQAILKITGTRILYEDSIILQGRTSQVYYGRYYGTFSPTITTTDLIAVTNLASNITALSYTSNQLTFTVSALSGATSTTQIYTADKGEPTSVSGASSWSYNSQTKILTLTAQHSSPVTITIDWTPQSGGTIPDDDEPFDLDLPDVPSLTIREIYRHIGFLIGILILAVLILYIQNPKKIRRFFRGLLLAKM